MTDVQELALRRGDALALSGHALSLWRLCRHVVRNRRDRKIVDLLAMSMMASSDADARVPAARRRPADASLIAIAFQEL